MQPRGPLMMEHRLIERMILLIGKEIKSIETTQKANQTFIDIAVDFIVTYADATHHGKEEQILFRDLSQKDLSAVDLFNMNELTQEHIFGRTTTAELAESAKCYFKGDATALPTMTKALQKFVDFYPIHIEKEDKVFFPASMLYFTEAEQQAMLVEFYEFDRNMIHEKYKLVVGAFESSSQMLL